MNKKIQHHLSKEKMIKYTLIGVFFFVVFHVVVFFLHQFLVYRYDVLYAEATAEGSLVEMPATFQKAHEAANKRSFLTRPDVLIREAGILQSGVRSLIEQYRNDVYRMHETIVGNIQALRIIAEMGDSLVLPERDEIVQRAHYLEAQIDMDKDAREKSLEELVTISGDFLAKAKHDLEVTQKKLVLQDIDAMEHEITFLASVYRVSDNATLVFSPKVFKKLYAESFSKAQLDKQNSEELRASWTMISGLLDPYRLEAQEIRKIAREKRADMVTQEAEKWKDTTPPDAPLPNIYAQIFISLIDQEMYVYEDGDLILSTPITSGRRDYETIRGTFQIYTKQRNKLMKSPFLEEQYELWVDYWMAFYGAYGIHDACNSKDCWRTVFGASSYVYNGSHGCINTPYNAVKFIYGWSRIGTTVHVR